MRIAEASGLPIELDPVTGELGFHDGLLCDGSSQKYLRQMKELFRDPDEGGADRLVYRAYRNIRYAADEPVFARFGCRYDITVVLPGTVNGEFFKTSGHYHASTTLAACPFPEVYEVIKGEIVFVLQRNHAFDRPDGGQIQTLQAVHVKAGQSIIIPPYCGHGSINPTDRAAAFSNIAVAACPNDYAPIKAHRGLAAYIMQTPEGGWQAVPNGHYGALPEITRPRPVEAPELGISFGLPCYRNFVQRPEQYAYLPQPDGYQERMNRLLGEERRA